MNFCVQCDNMYYIGISAKDSNKLTHYCRHCGHIDENLSVEGLCVLDTKLKQTEQKFNHIVNPYTKLDPTLPHIYNSKCPNGACKTNADEGKVPSDVIYIRYDDQQLKYLYICTVCDYVWKTDDK